MEPKPTRRIQYVILAVVALLGGYYMLRGCQGGALDRAYWYRDNGSAYALVYTGNRDHIEVRLMRPGHEARVLWDGPFADMPRLLGEHGSPRLVRFSGTLNEPLSALELVSLDGELLGQLTLATPAFPFQKIHNSIVACRNYDIASHQMNGLLRYGLDGQLVADFNTDAVYGYHVAERAPRILVWDATDSSCVLYDFDTAEKIYRFQLQRGFLSPDGRVAAMANPGEKTVFFKTVERAVDDQMVERAVDDQMVEKALGEVRLQVIDVDRAGFGFASDSSFVGVTDGPKLHRAQVAPFKQLSVIGAPEGEMFDPAHVYPLPGGRMAACRLGGPRNNPVRTVVVYNAGGKAVLEHSFEPPDDNGNFVFAMMPGLEGHRLYVLHGAEITVLDIAPTGEEADPGENGPAVEEEATDTVAPEAGG